MLGDIEKATEKILDHYDEIRGLTKEALGQDYWDLVVITASDEDQKVAYDIQIGYKLKRKEIPSGVQYLVFADPPGAKAGCGTSTMYVVAMLEDMFGAILKDYRILLINAGGQSKRLPSASVLGKLFTPLPLRETFYQMIDFILAIYLPLLDGMPPGVFHAASDIMVPYDLGGKSMWHCETQGFTALAHRSTLDVGTGHGVYVLEHTDRGNSTMPLTESRTCLKVLQKPSSEQMYAEGAVIHSPMGGDSIVYTDSVFFFDHSIAQKLAKFYRKEAPILCEIDSYGDFLQALGPKATGDYVQSIGNVTTVEPTLIETRKKVFELLKGTPLNLIILNASKFYHFGTMLEYIENICLDETVIRELGFQKFVFSKIVRKKTIGSNNVSEGDKSGSSLIQGVVMHSIISENSVISPSAILEYCNFPFKISVGSNCILNNCCCLDDMSINIPNDVIMHTVPVAHKGGNRYVTVAFSISDNIKKSVTRRNPGALPVLGSTVERIAKLLGADLESHIFGNVPAAGTCSLWNARLFPVHSTATNSFQQTLDMVHSLKEGSFVEGIKHDTLMSMADIIVEKSIERMLHQRNDLHEQILNSSL